MGQSAQHPCSVPSAEDCKKECGPRCKAKFAFGDDVDAVVERMPVQHRRRRAKSRAKDKDEDLSERTSLQGSPSNRSLPGLEEALAAAEENTPKAASPASSAAQDQEAAQARSQNNPILPARESTAEFSQDSAPACSHNEPILPARESTADLSQAATTPSDAFIEGGHRQQHVAAAQIPLQQKAAPVFSQQDGTDDSPVSSPERQQQESIQTARSRAAERARQHMENAGKQHESMKANGQSQWPQLLPAEEELCCSVRERWRSGGPQLRFTPRRAPASSKSQGSLSPSRSLPRLPGGLSQALFSEQPLAARSAFAVSFPAPTSASAESRQSAPLQLFAQEAVEEMPKAPMRQASGTTRCIQVQFVVQNVSYAGLKLDRHVGACFCEVVQTTCAKALDVEESHVVVHLAMAVDYHSHATLVEASVLLQEADDRNTKELLKCINKYANTMAAELNSLPEAIAHGLTSMRMQEYSLKISEVLDPSSMHLQSPGVEQDEEDAFNARPLSQRSSIPSSGQDTYRESVSMTECGNHLQDLMKRDARRIQRMEQKTEEDRHQLALIATARYGLGGFMEDNGEASASAPQRQWSSLSTQGSSSALLAGPSPAGSGVMRKVNAASEKGGPAAGSAYLDRKKVSPWKNPREAYDPTMSIEFQDPEVLKLLETVEGRYSMQNVGYAVEWIKQHYEEENLLPKTETHFERRDRQQRQLQNSSTSIEQSKQQPSAKGKKHKQEDDPSSSRYDARIKEALEQYEDGVRSSVKHVSQKTLQEVAEGPPRDSHGRVADTVKRMVAMKQLGRIDASNTDSKDPLGSLSNQSRATLQERADRLLLSTPTQIEEYWPSRASRKHLGSEGILRPS
eukprot:TRINITY_DN17542_c0_g1_i3.p1 TRINITY_DN17542_c0_g1~~TRINITY_DN17542_c0_g1_i3.p1  ORF type:complete len:855 (-),score=192.63 TRINITY_DN17542_c0_g1_i3:340-2904(-)